jgi:two-component sensor histidine kinase
MLEPENQWLYDALKRYEQQLFDHSVKGYCNNCFNYKELYRKGRCRLQALENFQDTLTEIEALESIQHAEYLKTLPTV